MGDTGLAASLLGVDAAALSEDRNLLGQLLETFVFQELRRQASWSEDTIRFHHLRDKDGYEVDIVLEREGREIAGVEVKASATVKNSDFRALRRLQAALGERFVAGIVLYDGESAVRFANNLFAVPLTSLWSRK
jgi:predicted AAA+ superfamily ATPase